MWPTILSFQQFRQRTLAEKVVWVLLVSLIVMLATLRVRSFDDQSMTAHYKMDIAHAFVVSQIPPALYAYHADMGEYPKTAEGIQALITAPANNPNVARWHGPYISSPEVPFDPWKRPYHYVAPGSHTAYVASQEPWRELPDKTRVAPGPVTTPLAPFYDIWTDGPTGIAGSPDTIGNWLK